MDSMREVVKHSVVDLRPRTLLCYGEGGQTLVVHVEVLRWKPCAALR